MQFQSKSKNNATIEKWTVDDVCGWLKRIGLSKYEPKFRENKIAGDVLDALSEEVLRNELDISAWGDRRRLITAIQELQLSKNLHPKNTSPTTELNGKRNQSALSIQKVWRGHMGRQRARKIRLQRNWERANLEQLWFIENGEAFERIELEETETNTRSELIIKIKNGVLSESANPREVVKNLRTENKLREELQTQLQTYHQHIQETRRNSLPVTIFSDHLNNRNETLLENRNQTDRDSYNKWVSDYNWVQDEMMQSKDVIEAVSDIIENENRDRNDIKRWQEDSWDGILAASTLNWRWSTMLKNQSKLKQELDKVQIQTKEAAKRENIIMKIESEERKRKALSDRLLKDDILIQEFKASTGYSDMNMSTVEFNELVRNVNDVDKNNKRKKNELEDSNYLPPIINKRDITELSNTSSSSWRASWNVLDSPSLVTLACERLQDIYLRVNKTVPLYIRRPESLWSTTVVDFSHIGLSDYHVAPFLVMAQRLKHLTCLHLDGNALTDHTAFLLSEVLPNCVSISRVTLSWNCITTSGGKKLVEAVSQSPHLVWLDLEGNNVSATYMLRIHSLLSQRSAGWPFSSLSHSAPLFVPDPLVNSGSKHQKRVLAAAPSRGSLPSLGNEGLSF